METLVSSSSTVVESGLRGVAFGVSVSPASVALGLSDGRIFYCSVGSQDLSILHDFDACPERTGIPLAALRYVPMLDCLVALSADGVLWMHLRDERNDMFFPGNCIADGVDSFDVVVLDDDALICTYCVADGLIQVLRVTRLAFDVVSEFPCPQEPNDGHNSRRRLVWATPTVIGVLSGTEFAYFVGLDGVLIPPVCTKRASKVLCLTSLAHSFSWDDRTSSGASLQQFALTFESTTIPNEHFTFRTSVMHVGGGEVRTIRTFDLLSNLMPRFTACHGPWLVVGGAHGLDFYDPENGDFAQSTLEDADLALCDLQWEVSVSKPSREWFTQHRVSVCVDTRDHMTLLTLQSFPDIISGLLQNAAFQMHWIEALMQFGHSVGANLLMPPGATANVSSKSVIFTSYGKLISRCTVHPGDEDDLVSSAGSDISPHRSSGGKTSDVCPVCWKKLSLIGSHRCNCCGQKVCSGCHRRIVLAEYGLRQLPGRTGPNGNVCLGCDGAADSNFYRLLVARRYHHVIRYLSSYPDRCSRFSLQEVIPCCIEQCFHEKKFQWAARLVCLYVQAEDAWHTWVLNFALEGKLGMLVDVLPDAAASAAGTIILLQLIRHDTQRLFRIVRRWRLSTYNADVVCEGIVTRLRALQRDALHNYDEIKNVSCTSGDSRGDIRANIGDLISVNSGARGMAYAWYFNAESEHLMLALLRIVDLNGSDGKDSVSQRTVAQACDPAAYRQCMLYLEHYLAWAPGQEFFSETRRRSESVFGNGLRRVAATRRFLDVFDFWDVFSANKLLPRFLSSNPSFRGEEPLLISILQHYGAEYCRHLFTFEGAQFHELLDATVSILEPTPIMKLIFLHELTIFSPNSTAGYHQELAELYLEFAPGSLLGFVRNREVDALDWLKLASQVEQRRMFQELVYIIGRTGNDSEAIRVALRCLGNVSLAIEYVVDSGDETLWELTIGHVLQSQSLIGQFLDVVGDRYDPAKFLARIPSCNRFNIPHVCPKLARLCVDRQCTENIAEAQVHVVAEESFGRMRRLQKESRKGVRVAPFMETCILCKQPTFLENSIVAGHRGVLHASCFQKTFKRMHSKEDHITKELMWDLARFRAKKSVAVRDPVELVPRNVLVLVSSFLDPYSRLCCEAVSMKWRRTFVGLRRSVWSTGGNLHGIYRQKVHSRMTRLNPNPAAINRTVSSTTLTSCGLYYLRDEEIQ